MAGAPDRGAEMTHTDTIALAVAAAVVLTMPAFAVAARGRARDAEVLGRPATMLLGRLELFTLLVVFTPGFWRK